MMPHETEFRSLHETEKLRAEAVALRAELETAERAIVDAFMVLDGSTPEGQKARLILAPLVVARLKASYTLAIEGL